ncbi:MAG: HAMP domain-containing protein [Deltaproteobacteria bacterium]|nr:HAMP domain-containing protein [Deltaproteobacteria bacterium]
MRIPLHFKLAASYLLVVGLVLVPTAVYLQTSLRKGQRHAVRVELQGELRDLTARLDAAPADQLGARIDILCGALPLRMTVVEPGGRVICDSRYANLRNHGDRDEIRQAFADAEGFALRPSATTGEMTLYVARRFPSHGQTRGVIRLSRPVSAVDAASVQVAMVVRQTSAIALTVAALLSLLAAMVASRPLRHMAQAARSFSEGDFAAEIPAPSDDEIGEVAQALEHLASQLRGKLLASGADRSTLFALMDELPVGLILYGADRQPTRINGLARRLLGLRPHDEQARGAELPELPGCREAVDRVMEDGFTREVSLAPPWLQGSPRRARWLAAYAPDGQRCPALVILDAGSAGELAAARAMIARCAEVLRDVASRSDPTTVAAQAGELGRAAEALLPVGPPTHDGVEVLAIGTLLRAAQEALSTRLAAEGTRLDASGADYTLAVVEIDGRARRSVEALLAWAIEARAGASTVRVRVAAADGAARVIVRGSTEVASPGAELTEWLGPMGGAVGERVNEDQVERWVSLALA